MRRRPAFQSSFLACPFAVKGFCEEPLLRERMRHRGLRVPKIRCPNPARPFPPVTRAILYTPRGGFNVPRAAVKEASASRRLLLSCEAAETGSRIKELTAARRCESLTQPRSTKQKKTLLSLSIRVQQSQDVLFEPPMERHSHQHQTYRTMPCLIPETEAATRNSEKHNLRLPTPRGCQAAKADKKDDIKHRTHNFTDLRVRTESQRLVHNLRRTQPRN